MHFCAAVILEASYIITAAHCIEDKMSILSNITVCAGSDRLSDACPQSRPVGQVIIHHEYKNRTHENDIAIIHLNKPFDFTDRWISKICLPSTETGSQYPLIGTNVIAIGWGTAGTNDIDSDNLQQVTLKVMDDTTSACSNLINNRTVQICANGLNKGKFFLLPKYRVSNVISYIYLSRRQRWTTDAIHDCKPMGTSWHHELR